MTFIEAVQYAEELYELVQDLKKDGVIDKIIAAEEAVKAEMETNPKVKVLMDKTKLLFSKK